MYICGDYNINLLNNTVLSNLLKNILIQLGISNIIDMPTSITKNSHNYILFVKRKAQYKYSRNINDLNLHNLKLELGTIHWNTILNNQNCCKLYNTFIDILTNSINKHNPFVKKRF